MGIRIEQFIRPDLDFETAQYTILAGLQAGKRNFHRNRLYPELAELISLHDGISRMLKQVRQLQQGLPREIREVDLQEGTIRYERLGRSQADHYIEDLIEWALPHVRDAIDEGRTLYDFVEEQLTIEEVGILPLYKSEGYLLVRDRRSRTVHVLQYTLSIIVRSGDRYRSLHTRLISSTPYTDLEAPQEIKKRLRQWSTKLTNPATYFIDAGIELPFESTLLPVAKRKLMQQLSQGTA